MNVKNVRDSTPEVNVTYDYLSMIKITIDRTRPIQIRKKMEESK